MNRSFYQKHEGLILGGTAVLMAVALWQAIWSAGKISPLFFTGPSTVVSRFGKSGRAATSSRTWHSGTNFVIGVGLAIAAASCSA